MKLLFILMEVFLVQQFSLSLWAGPNVIVSSLKKEEIKELGQLTAAKLTSENYNQLKEKYGKYCELINKSENASDTNVYTGLLVSCLRLAEIEDSLNREEQASMIRMNACSKNPLVCKQFINQVPPDDFKVAFDLASILCENPVRGFLHKNLLHALCSFKNELKQPLALGDRWYNLMERAYSTSFDALKKSLPPQGSKSPLLDFTVVEPKMLNSFSESLRRAQFPLNVRFKLYKLSHWFGPSRLKPSGRELYVSEFSGGEGNNWRDHFSGYAILSYKDLRPVLEKLRRTRFSTDKVTANGKIIGYTETGVVPVPVIWIESLQ